VSAATHTRPNDPEARLGHRFADPALLAAALTHPSVGGRDYQRLEFLGDRVLGLVVAGMLYRTFPREAEGALAKRLAALVRRDALAAVAGDLGLGQLVRVSKGEDEAGGRENPSLLADALEAVIGAIYLDGGLAPAEAFIRRHWTAPLIAARKPPQDAKTRLQEWAQAAGRPLPVYTLLSDEGPRHAPTFAVEARVEGLAPARGNGSSKRAAETAAAQALLAIIESETPS